MGSKRKPYDAEFRDGAVRIVIETGKTIPEVAEELGVYPGTSCWTTRPPPESETGSSGCVNGHVVRTTWPLTLSAEITAHPLCSARRA
ncbi:transposase [Streptomyces sp. NPDC005071]